MVLLLHVIIAFSSVAYTTHTVFRPSNKALRASYALLTLTIASGTGLVLLHPTIMARACMSGLAYTAVVFAMIAVAKRRLATQEL